MGCGQDGGRAQTLEMFSVHVALDIADPELEAAEALEARDGG